MITDTFYNYTTSWSLYREPFYSTLLGIGTSGRFPLFSFATASSVQCYLYSHFTINRLNCFHNQYLFLVQLGLRPPPPIPRFHPFLSEVVLCLCFFASRRILALPPSLSPLPYPLPAESIV